MPYPRLDLDLLRSFVAVADAGGITRAAERLRLAQPTVSLQLKRLEAGVGHRLLHRAEGRLTAEGESLLSYARRILALADEALSRLALDALRGTVRLGTPEDFATSKLPDVLSRFAASHPGVALEVTTDLTLNLLDRFGRGEFDLVLIKREPQGGGGGVRVWREPLVWAARDASVFEAGGFDSGNPALPLVVSPHPCVYRRRAMRALDEAGRPWRVAYTSTSLAGAQAAVRAGLGVTVLPKGMVPAGLAALDATHGAPRLPDTEIALLRAAAASVPAQRLGDHIVGALERAP
ncbi:LysR substrate-binding domain-containing protein [Plastoroseomonas arctica]|uniref:LysR family transcriptional regulator n=1 Tax=Plastoroseomonas arctica TaxID=1509237 RepID=A0AAF1KNH5_9PROT|nr:LysR substrate-binding domain-containing protein [Plastoroseomonas arctica]MBR0654583.1 LysR family transcriptional regulator [Plastoroseomonas arctica]